MKKAGEILSALFDKKFAEKAMGYSKFFNSWADITEKNGIGSAAAHSRIKDEDKGIVLIEVDHPGWKQILQTKQSKLLHDFRYRFPDMDISAISLMLSKDEQIEESFIEEPRAEAQAYLRYGHEERGERKKSEQQVSHSVNGMDSIKDEDFKQKLIQLGQTIADSESHP